MALTFHPPTILIEQARGLTWHTRVLRDLAHSDHEHVTTLVTATLLVAAAAAEAILSEYARAARPDVYGDKQFRLTNPASKFESLVGTSSQDLVWLWGVRTAIAHSEPDHVRSGRFGADITLEGADRAYGILCDLIVRVWDDAVPGWFAEVTGISSSA